MKILALDLGKSKTVVCLYETEKGLAHYETAKTTPPHVRDALVRHRADRLVLEVGPMAGWVHDLGKAQGMTVQVANPTHEGWRWKKVRSKTDRKDALKMAQLSAANQLPMVYMPSRAVRERRSLIGYRDSLVDRRKAIKNRIRSILDRQGLRMKDGRSGWTVESLKELRLMAGEVEGVGGDELWRMELYEELEGLGHVEGQILRVERKLNALGDTEEKVRLLRTVPGVGPRLSEALVAVIDDASRFKSARKVGSYVGLVPRLFASGQSSRSGRITRAGNSLLRKLLVEVSWVCLRYNPYFRSIYERVKGGSEKRKKIAIVAVARRLLVTAWAMMRDGTRWRVPRIAVEASAAG
jgi:transposase